MKTRYSQTTGAFYPFSEDYGDKLPADVIEVSQEDFSAAMSRPEGYAFDFVDGQLEITAPPPVPFADLAVPYMAEVRATREAILNRLAGIGMAALVAGEEANASAVLNARQALLNITEAPAVLAANTIEALHFAVKDEYKAIANSAPEWLRNAFNGVDS